MTKILLILPPLSVSILQESNLGEQSVSRGSSKAICASWRCEFDARRRNTLTSIELVDEVPHGTYMVGTRYLLLLKVICSSDKLKDLSIRVNARVERRD